MLSDSSFLQIMQNTLYDVTSMLKKQLVKMLNIFDIIKFIGLQLWEPGWARIKVRTVTRPKSNEKKKSSDYNRHHFFIET